MIVRLFGAFVIALAFATTSHAGDQPGQQCEPGKDCGIPAPQPVPPPQQEPEQGFCDGVYEGFLAYEPGPLTIEIHQADDCGGIDVTGHWGGATWVGRGICRRVSPGQAMVVFQYPNTPVQRGTITLLRDGGAELDGQVDGGDSFRLMRHDQGVRLQ